MEKLLVLGLTFAVILSLSFGCGCIGDAPVVQPVQVEETTNETTKVVEVVRVIEVVRIVEVAATPEPEPESEVKIWELVLDVGTGLALEVSFVTESEARVYLNKTLGDFPETIWTLQKNGETVDKVERKSPIEYLAVVKLVEGNELSNMFSTKRAAENYITRMQGYYPGALGTIEEVEKTSYLGVGHEGVC